MQRKNTKQFIEQNINEIEKWLKEGKSINQIIRFIGFACDQRLRKYLADNRPELSIIAKQNGMLRQGGCRTKGE